MNMQIIVINMQNMRISTKYHKNVSHILANPAPTAPNRTKGLENYLQCCHVAEVTHIVHPTAPFAERAGRRTSIMHV